MKVLQVINSLATGGAEKLLLDSIPKYQKNGIHMDVLVLNGTEYPFYTDFQKNTNSNLFHLGKSSVYNPLHVFKLIKYLKKYEIIHVHLFPSLYWVALAKWIGFSKSKIIFTEHSTNNRRMNNWFLQQLDQLVYSKYNAIICITQEVKSQLMKQLRLPNSNFIVIENGIDLSTINSAEKYTIAQLNLPIPNNSKLLIQVASFQFPKDQATVIKALQLLPQEVHLLLVGQGPLLNEAKNLAQQGNVMERVHFLGVRMDVPKLLKTADIVVLSSMYEGLSLSCIEGMASGRPFIASDVIGLKEMVSGHGLLFPFGDDVKLAEILQQLLSNTNQANDIAEKCQIKAKQYDSSIMVDHHIKLYQSLL